MLFSLKNACKVVRPGFTAFVYNSKEDLPPLNTVLVDCHKDHEKVYVKESHRVYFVMEGSGTFTVGKEIYKVQPFDVVVIPPKVPYSYEGKMKLFEANFPATGEEDEVRVEDG